jgi:class 3 adenylate cyclase
VCIGCTGSGLREPEGRVEDEIGTIILVECGAASPTDAVRLCATELARRGTVSVSDFGVDPPPLVVRLRERKVVALELGRDALRSGDAIGRLPCRSR